MKQVVQHLRTGRLELVETPAPLARRGYVLVRTSASAISPGTERQMLRWGRQSLLEKARSRPDLVRRVLGKVRRDGWLPTLREAMALLDTRRPLGYSSSGVAVAVGDDVDDIRPGDRVACGGAGFAAHAEIACVPRNLVARVPAQVSDDHAAFAMLAAIALRGIQRAQIHRGDNVAVIGLGLLGQLAVQVARADGARVLAVDVDERRAQMAKELGADATANAGSDDLAGAARVFTGGVGCDAVVITAASRTSEPLLAAAEMARPRGRVVAVGLTGMTVPREAFWEKELELRFSHAAGPGSEEPVAGPPDAADERWTVERNLKRCLELMAAGQIRLAPLITHRFAITDTSQAYRLVMGETQEPHIGIALFYEGTDVTTCPQEPQVVLHGQHTPAAAGEIEVAVIGSGQFARSTLLPALRRVPGVRVRAVVSAGGLSAVDTADRMGAAYAASDVDAVLADDRVSAVIIATRHDLHGPLAVRALRAGKHVFVEKPPAMAAEELGGLLRAIRESGRVLMVGYNRRFAPLVRVMRGCAADVPLLVTCRVNAGWIPRDHWVHDPVQGGGRLFSETCHFVDLIQYLTDAMPVSVFARASDAVDAASYLVSMNDGSVGVVAFTGAGEREFSRERVELFGPHIAGVLDDYRRLEIVRAGQRRVYRAWGDARGYREELAAWVAAVRGEAAAPAPEIPLLATLATLQALRSIRSGVPEPVEPHILGVTA